MSLKMLSENVYKSDKTNIGIGKIIQKYLY